MTVLLLFLCWSIDNIKTDTEVFHCCFKVEAVGFISESSNHRLTVTRALAESSVSRKGVWGADRANTSSGYDGTSFALRSLLCTVWALKW